MLVEELEELKQLRLRVYELEDYGFKHWLRMRWIWFKRTPILRMVWFIAIIIGTILSWIKAIFFIPTHALKYEPKLLEKQAKERAKIDLDFDDNFHEIALKTVVINSLLKSEMRDFLPIVPFPQMLEKKLRIQQALKTLGTKINSRPPAIFIIGLPRTGSTFLHHICSLDRFGRSIRAWEFRMPFECSDAPQNPLKRIQKTQHILDVLYKLAPAIRSVHYIRSMDADECIQGFYDCTLLDWYLWGAIDAPEAFSWYVNADMTAQYDNYERFLRVVLNHPDNRSKETESLCEPFEPKYLWLKTPHHTYKLLELAKVFPEAKFVWIHRDPVKCVGSCCSMNQAILDISCPRFVDPRILGERTFKRLKQCVDKGLSDRKVLEQQGRVFVDVKYTDLKANLYETLKKMYQDLELDVSAIRNPDFLKAATVGSEKGHQYKLEDFGLDSNRIYREFASYMSEYL